MLNSDYAQEFASEIDDLRKWTNEILVAAFKLIQVRPPLSSCFFP
jgi:hypothetical protein